MKRKSKHVKYIYNKFKPSKFYSPTVLLKSDELFIDGGLNPSIELLYNTYNIKNYKIIDLFTEKQISIILKEGAKPIVVIGRVEAIDETPISVLVKTSLYKTTLMGKGNTNKLNYQFVYILNKDLGRKELRYMFHMGISWGLQGILISILWWLLLLIKPLYEKAFKEPLFEQSEDEIKYTKIYGLDEIEAPSFDISTLSSQTA